MKDVIVSQPWSDNRRRNVINAYAMFAKLNKLPFEKPRCVVAEKIPFVPTEQEIDALISASGKKLVAFLQLLKETAMRRGEGKRLNWTDVDSVRNIIRLNTPEKHSSSRMWKVSPRLIAMLNALPKTSQRVFGDSSMDSMKTMFMTVREKTAAKLQNPRLREIRFHTLRYWKGTTFYHQTRDPFLTRDFLGHRSMKNTEIYVKLAKTIFGQGSDDEFTVRVTDKPDEVKSLLEVGFEYVCQKEDLIFLRKRK